MSSIELTQTDTNLLSNRSFLGAVRSVNLIVTMLTALVSSLAMNRVYFSSIVGGSEGDGKKSEGGGGKKTISGSVSAASRGKRLRRKFSSFKNEYLLVYVIIMLADWMQGTHMYTLYLSYGVDISTLFLVGFLSGAIFAPFLGSFIDKFGRKNSCILYCVLEIVINTMEHSTNFPILLLGRILGGVSTNLLFTSFESWMTTDFRKKGFPDAWLSEVFAASAVANGVMAVLAGIVAQQLEDYFGHIGPFKGAVFLTVVALLLILRWDENYGDTTSSDDDEDSDDESSALTAFYQQFQEGWQATLSDVSIMKIGIIQSLSEGAMYTFVFMWVPTLLNLAPDANVPTGAVFSSLMLAITMGGTAFPVVDSICKSSELAATLTYSLGALCMMCPALCLSQEGGACFIPVLVAFVMVEFSIGLFFPAAACLRSKYIPDHLQGAILNIFRLPLNLLVVIGTKCTDEFEPATVYWVITSWFLIAALLQFSMTSTWQNLGAPKKEKKGGRGKNNNKNNNNNNKGDASSASNDINDLSECVVRRSERLKGSPVRKKGEGNDKLRRRSSSRKRSSSRARKRSQKK